MNFRFHAYLDVLRGAFYSVLIGILITDLVRANPFYSINSWYLFLPIITYFILDGTVRFRSREIIRFNYDSSHEDIPVYYEFIGFLLEILGLLIFFTWSYHYLYFYESNNEYNCVLVGIFTLVAALHNGFLIFIDKGISVTEFVLFAIIKNAGELKNINNRWQALTSKLHKNVFTLEQDAEKKCRDVFANDKSSSRLQKLILSFFYCIISILRGGVLSILNFAVQFITLHFIHFNLLAFMLIIGLLPTNVLITRFSFYIYIVISLSLYFVASLLEKERINEKGEKIRDADWLEALIHAAGTIFLIILTVSIYMSFKEILVFIILVQQFIVGVILLLEAEPSSISAQNLSTSTG